MIPGTLRRHLVGLAYGISLALGPLRGAESLPDWAAAVAATPEPAVSPEAGAVMLLNDLTTEFAADGRRTNRQRVVVRILKQEGREYARAAVGYIHPADKVRRLEAWLNDRQGKTRHFGRKDIVDVAADTEMLYSESRVAIIDTTREAGAGDVYAWESVTEEPPGRPQVLFAIQDRLPVTSACFRLLAPANWQVQAVVEHWDMPSLFEADGERVWTLSGLPEVKDEPLAPPATHTGVRMLVRIDPPASAKGVAGDFSTWAEIAAFARGHFRDATATSPALQRRVKELCAGKTSQWERVRAVAEFVQQFRYVAIATDLRRDGGFIPRPADTVLRCGYGDCKDKTALLCAMLREIGVNTFPVLCYSGDRGAVRADWPASGQFNHMFAAIEVAPLIETAYSIETPSGAEVLLFDPTDQFTPIGSFPLTNQGGLALVCTGDADQLTPIPYESTAANRIETRIEAVLSPEGTLSGSFVETRHGGASVVERYRELELTKARKSLVDDLKATVRRATVTDAEVTHDPVGNLVKSLRFEIPRHGQSIRRDLLAVPKSIAREMVVPVLNDTERTRPVRLFASETDAAITITAAEGFHLVATADPEPLVSPFGSYEVHTHEADGKVTLRRRLVLQGIDVPVADYTAIRQFLDTVRKYEKAPLLFERN